MSHVSHDDTALPIESKESMHRETDCWTETEKEKREGSVISFVKSMSEKSRRDSSRSNSLRTLRNFYSDGRDFGVKRGSGTVADTEERARLRLRSEGKQGQKHDIQDVLESQAKTKARLEPRRVDQAAAHHWTEQQRQSASMEKQN